MPPTVYPIFRRLMKEIKDLTITTPILYHTAVAGDYGDESRFLLSSFFFTATPPGTSFPVNPEDDSFVEWAFPGFTMRYIGATIDPWTGKLLTIYDKKTHGTQTNFFHTATEIPRDDGKKYTFYENDLRNIFFIVAAAAAFHNLYDIDDAELAKKFLEFKKDVLTFYINHLFISDDDLWLLISPSPGKDFSYSDAESDIYRTLRRIYHGFIREPGDTQDEIERKTNLHTRFQELVAKHIDLIEAYIFPTEIGNAVDMTMQGDSIRDVYMRIRQAAFSSNPDAQNKALEALGRAGDPDFEKIKRAATPPADGSAYNICGLLRTHPNLAGKWVTAEEICLQTKNRLHKYEHLSLETVERDLGVLFDLGLIDRETFGEEMRYKTLQFDWEIAAPVLEGLGWRPGREDINAAKEHLDFIKRIRQIYSKPSYAANGTIVYAKEHPTREWYIGEIDNNIFLRGILGREIGEHNRGKSLLSVGIGHAIFEKEELKDFWGLDVTGIDLVRESVEIAKRRGIPTTVGDGEYLQFENETFDIILLSESIGYMDNPDKALTEAYRVLKPGGTIYITTHTPDATVPKFFEYKLYEESAILSAMKEAGFRGARSAPLAAERYDYLLIRGTKALAPLPDAGLAHSPKPVTDSEEGSLAKGLEAVEKKFERRIFTKKEFQPERINPKTRKPYSDTTVYSELNGLAEAGILDKNDESRPYRYKLNYHYGRAPPRTKEKIKVILEDLPARPAKDQLKTARLDIDSVYREEFTSYENPKFGEYQANYIDGKPPVILMLGMPGSGKDTVGGKLAEALELPHVSMGGLVGGKRQRNPHLDPALLDNPEYVYGTLLKDFLLKKEGDVDQSFRHGFIINDSPRTPHSIEALNNFIEKLGFRLTIIAHIRVSAKTAKKRIAKRSKLSSRRWERDRRIVNARITGYMENVPPQLRAWRRDTNLVVSVDNEGEESKALAAILSILEQRGGISHIPYGGSLAATAEPNLPRVFRGKKQAAPVEPPHDYSAVDMGDHKPTLLSIVPRKGETLKEQASDILKQVDEILRETGCTRDDVVKQAIFMRDISGKEKCKDIFDNYYRGSPAGSKIPPATSYIQQPPLAGEELVAELFVVPQDENTKVIRINEYLTILEQSGIKWVYIAGIEPDKGIEDTYEQALNAFYKMKKLLEDKGFSLNDIIRTWFYINNIIKKDKQVREIYQLFNQVRKKFFDTANNGNPIEFAKGLPPASTGIGMSGGTIVMECLALSTEREDISKDPLKNPWQLDAHAYEENVLQEGREKEEKAPPLFSRGINIADKMISVSGTAATEGKEGLTKHIWNPKKPKEYSKKIKAQTELTIKNIPRVIEQAGADMANIKQIRIYIARHKEYSEAQWETAKRVVQEVVKMRFPSRIPRLFLEADVCRDNFLVEIEALVYMTPDERRVWQNNNAAREHKKLSRLINEIAEGMYPDNILKTTPLLPMRRLSEITGKPVYLKDESMQYAGSFKIRGVIAEVAEAIESRIGEMRQKPLLRNRPFYIVTQTDGNHGIAMIEAVRLLIEKYRLAYPELNDAINKIEPIMFTLKDLPEIKRTKMQEALLAYRKSVDDDKQGNIFADYENYEEAKKARESFIKKHAQDSAYMEHGGLTIMAGHGSAGIEIDRQLREMFKIGDDKKVTILVPVGAGGPVGIGAALKLKRPNTSIILVQTRPYSAFVRSLNTGVIEKNKPDPPSTVEIKGKGIVFEDGIAVDGPEEEALRIAEKICDAAVAVDPEKNLNYAAPLMLRDLQEAREQSNVVIGGTTAAGGQALLEFGNEIKAIKEADAVVLLGTEGNVDLDVTEYIKGLAEKIKTITAPENNRDIARLNETGKQMTLEQLFGSGLYTDKQVSNARDLLSYLGISAHHSLQEIFRNKLVRPYIKFKLHEILIDEFIESFYRGENGGNWHTYGITGEEAEEMDMFGQFFAEILDFRQGYAILQACRERNLLNILHVGDKQTIFDAHSSLMYGINVCDSCEDIESAIVHEVMALAGFTSDSFNEHVAKVYRLWREEKDIPHIERIKEIVGGEEMEMRLEVEKGLFGVTDISLARQAGYASKARWGFGSIEELDGIMVEFIRHIIQRCNYHAGKIYGKDSHIFITRASEAAQKANKEESVKDAQIAIEEWIEKLVATCNSGNPEIKRKAQEYLAVIAQLCLEIPLNAIFEEFQLQGIEMTTWLKDLLENAYLAEWSSSPVALTDTLMDTEESELERMLKEIAIYCSRANIYDNTDTDEMPQAPYLAHVAYGEAVRRFRRYIKRRMQSPGERYGLEMGEVFKMNIYDPQKKDIEDEIERVFINIRKDPERFRHFGIELNALETAYADYAVAKQDLRKINREIAEARERWNIDPSCKLEYNVIEKRYGTNIAGRFMGFLSRRYMADTKRNDFYRRFQQELLFLSVAERDWASLKDFGEEKDEAIAFVDELIMRAKEAKDKGQHVILGLDTSWIPDMKARHGTLLTSLLREIDRLPGMLKKRGLDNLIFVKGAGEELARDIVDKEKHAGFSNIIVLADKENVKQGKFDDIKKDTRVRKTLLVSVNPKNLQSRGTRKGVHILDMYLLAMALFDGKKPEELNAKYVRIETDGEEIVFTPIEPFDIEKFNTYEIQAEEIASRA